MRMPKKNQKSFQVILAIVIALAMWLYVINVENPAGTAHIRDVPVQLQGEKTLEENGLMVTGLSRDGITVSLNGKKKTLMKISRKNLSLIVDVSSVTEAGSWTLAGRLSYPATVSGDSVTISRWDDLRVIVTVEPKTTKTVPVRGEFMGTEAEGYQTGTVTVAPDTLTLTGPEDTLDKIAYALAQVEGEELSSSFTVQSPFILMTVDNIPADVANVTPEMTAVDVTVPIRRVAEVPLTVELLPGGGATEEDVSCAITPSAVTLVAEEEDEVLPESISLGQIQLSEVFDGASYRLPIQIPDDAEGWNAPEYASVRLTTRGLVSLQVPVETSRIVLKNVPEGYTAEMVSDHLYVWVRGPAGAVTDLAQSNLSVTADLSGVSAGGSLQRIPVDIALTGEGREAAGVLGGHYSVALRLVPRGDSAYN